MPFIGTECSSPFSSCWWPLWFRRIQSISSQRYGCWFPSQTLFPNVCKIRFTVTGYKVMKGKWYLESISSFFYTIEQTAVVCYGKLKVVARLNGVAAGLWTCNKRITEKESIDNRLRVDLLVLYTTNAASPNSFQQFSTVQGHFQGLLIFGDCILSIITTNSTCT